MIKNTFSKLSKDFS